MNRSEMNTIESETLYEHLPLGSDETLKGDAPNAIGIAEKDHYFVEPTLRTEETIPPWKAPISIISAPGAVGKSALAKNISARGSVYLWDLARLNLGLGSFMGIIAESFGADRLEPIVDNLSSGKELFVLDAFDEAELKEGFGRIERLVQECWKVVSKSKNTSLVFLARTRTAENLAAAIELASLSDEEHSRQNPCSVLEIDYFNESKSMKFIDSEIRRISNSKGDHNILERYESHKEPFDKAIESVFTSAAESFRVEDNIWKNHEVRSFLGYAPVLQAISKYMTDPEHGNFHEIRKNIEDNKVGPEEADITTSLVVDLLEREMLKVQNRIREKTDDEIENKYINKIYTPQEQLKRILLYARKGNNEKTNAPPDTKELTPDVPGKLLVEYHESLYSFVSQHPFVKDKEFTSPAFRDYLYAEALKWGNLNLQKLARNILVGSEYTPTPLLLWFYKEEGRNLVNAKDIGIIYESFSSRDSAFNEQSCVEIYPRENQERDKLHEATFIRLDKDGFDKNTSYNFKVRPENDKPEILFPRRIENAIVYVNGKVILGNESNEVDITDSEIISESISLRSTSVVAKCRTEGHSVLITADEFDSPPQNVEVTKFGDGELVVQWPGAHRHPWHDFHRDIQNFEDATYSHAFSALRRILLCFRRDRRDDLARYDDYVDKVVVGKSSIKEDMIEYLIDKEVIYHENSMYKVNVNKLSNYDISWSAIHRGESYDQISDFLESFLSQIS